MEYDMDSDGDVLVQRNSQKRICDHADAVLSEVHLETAAVQGGYSITQFSVNSGSPPLALRHRMATPLSAVGLQARLPACDRQEYAINANGVVQFITKL